MVKTVSDSAAKVKTHRFFQPFPELNMLLETSRNLLYSVFIPKCSKEGSRDYFFHIQTTMDQVSFKNHLLVLD